MKRTKVMSMHLLAHALYLKGVPVLPGLISRLIRLIFACEIPVTCELAESVNLMHGGLGVVIHDRAVIGDNTRIYQNVTIGGRGPGGGHPCIGRNVYIGAGACVLGGVRIGNDVKIGANSVVITDIPDYCTAVGVPAKVVPQPDLF